MTIFLLLPLTLSSHPWHEDPVYAELNDYLMAIQIMRYEDPRAAEIFDTWRELRDASWKIRELTDEENLLISSPQVMDQIAATKKKQNQLLRECRQYLRELVNKERAVRINIGSTIDINWTETPLKVQVGHRKVVLIDVHNTLDSAVTVTIGSNQNDQILFWNKKFKLKPQSSRFTYLVCSPLQETQTSNELMIMDDRGIKQKTTIRLNGLPTVDRPFMLIPGDQITKVVLPEKVDDKPRSNRFDDGIFFDIRDHQTNQYLPVRVKVTDESGNAHWSPLKGQSLAINRNSGWQTTIWDYQPGPYFYLYGETTLGVNPTGKTVQVNHGFEYLPQSIQVPGNGNVRLSMRRWINMSELGWYAGHTHIHTTDVGIPVQLNRHWPLVSRAEDLQVSTILTLKGEWLTHAIYADEYPLGVREAFTTDDHILAYGEEYRSNPYGHLVFIGIDHLIQPISSGALGELGGPDYPPNTMALDQALQQGGNTIAAHFGNFVKEVTQIKSPWPSTGFEMPVDIALGKIQLAEIYGNGGQLDVWYDILNCGFRVPATAGPDWVIKDSPRTYVYLGGQSFTFDNWRDGLQKGRSFITKGPMLFFEVNDQMPGSEIKIGTGSNQVKVTATAKVPNGTTPVEIVFNGIVIYSGSKVDTTLTLHDSGWIAARCKGAHSNPVYVNFEDRPPGFSAPALRFIEVIDRLRQWVNKKGLFESDIQKEEVLAVLTKGEQVYRNIVEQAYKLGR